MCLASNLQQGLGPFLRDFKSGEKETLFCHSPPLSPTAILRLARSISPSDGHLLHMILKKSGFFF